MNLSNLYVECRRSSCVASIRVQMRVVITMLTAMMPYMMCHVVRLTLLPLLESVLVVGVWVGVGVADANKNFSNDKL